MWKTVPIYFILYSENVQRYLFIIMARWVTGLQIPYFNCHGRTESNLFVSLLATFNTPGTLCFIVASRAEKCWEVKVYRFSFELDWMWHIKCHGQFPRQMQYAQHAAAYNSKVLFIVPINCFSRIGNRVSRKSTVSGLAEVDLFTLTKQECELLLFLHCLEWVQEVAAMLEATSPTIR